MVLLAIPTFLLSLVGLVLSVYYGTVATLNRKPGVPYFSGGAESPGNILFRRHQLTEKGLRARKSCFKWLGVMLAGMALMFVLGILNSVIGDK